MTEVALPDDRALIERLMRDYTATIDSGDLDGFAQLFTHGSWIGQRGREAVHRWLLDTMILYDGSPCTEHRMSNVAISLDAASDTARATCRITVTQQRPGVDLAEVIAVNDYTDRFVRVDDRWWFTERTMRRVLIGDMSHHRRDRRSNQTT
jgi:hypothetical protein